MNTKMKTEPVRVSGWVALIVGLVLTAGFSWATGLDVREIVGQLTIMAITSIGGLEFARQQVWSPASHETRVNQAVAMNERRADQSTVS